MTARIAVYGATGYTGRLVASELAGRGCEVVVAGRSEGALVALARELEAEFGTPPDVRPARVEEPEALRAALRGCDAVAACAGPFAHAGEPVLAAAVAEGVPYVDTSGEQAFIRSVFERWDVPAAAAGVALVPALGFDYCLGDCLAALAADDLGPLTAVTVAYAVEHFAMTRGTLRSALEMLRGEGDVVYEDYDWRPAPPERARARMVVGDGPAQAVLRYPAGEVITVPRHVDVARVTTWLTAATLARVEALVPAVGALAPAASRLLGTPVRRALSRAIDRLPAGPDEATRRRATFTLVADAAAEDGARRRLVLRGADVYGTTAQTIAEGATRLAEEGAPRPGALAAAEAFGARDFLAAIPGVTRETRKS